MNRPGWLPSPSVMLLLWLLPGCGSSPPPQPNLSPTAVAVTTPAADVQASHRLEARVTIASTTAVEGVGVAFRAFPRAAYDAHAEEIESHVLGGAAFDVPAGGGTFTALLEVPSEVPAGEYYLVPEVDPLDTVVEADEADQAGVTAAMVVRDEHRDHPRLLLEQATLDVPAFELGWVLGAPPPPLGLTVLVRAEGNAPVTGAELTACASGPRTGCVDLPLGIWDSEAGRHRPRLVLPELLPGEPNSVHLDLHFDAGLAGVFESLMSQLATSCLASLDGCVRDHGVHLACAQDCLAPVVSDPAGFDPLALQACLLTCVPFTVRATIDRPGVVLFDPTVALPGRSIEADLRLLPPPPISPLAPAVLTLKPLVEPVVEPWETILGWAWAPASIGFAADKGGCAEPIAWAVELVPGQPAGTYASAGAMVGLSEGLATWLPPLPSDPDARTTRVRVEARACGEVAAVVATLAGRSPAVLVTPARVAVEAGADGAVELRAAVSDCAVDPQLAWSLEGGGGRLSAGPGTLVVGADPLVARYTPPVSMDPGAPVPVTVRATAEAPACTATATATVEVGLPTALAFEKGFDKSFSTDLFGAGVELYAGAFLDRGGGRADAHARVPVKIFGAAFDLLELTDHASVDPRQAAASHFLHQLDVFGVTVNALSCPGGEGCAGSATLWSDQKCRPGPPPICLGPPYLTPCTRSATCPAGYKCLNRMCTKKCDEPDDCPGGACGANLPVSPYRRVFVVVVIPVTIEGQVCAEYGIDASFNLLTPVPDVFSATLNPFFELGGHASAAVGLTGLAAVGVGGEVVLVREDFKATIAAGVSLVHGVDCPATAGCIQGWLRESVENDLRGGEGKIYLFADYPTIKWCRWYPCVGTAHATRTLASWGSLYRVANTCNWCEFDAQCGSNRCVPAPGGKGRVCDDGYPGWLCRQQDLWVSAE